MGWVVRGALASSLFLGSWAHASAQWSELCRGGQPLRLDEWYKPVAECDSSGKLQYLDLFAEGMGGRRFRSMRYEFDANTKLSARRVFDGDGNQTDLTEFQHINGDQYSNRRPASQRSSELDSVVIGTIDPQTLLFQESERQYINTSQGRDLLTLRDLVEQIENSNPRISTRELYDSSGEVRLRYEFGYDPDVTLYRRLIHTRTYDREGKLIGEVNVRQVGRDRAVLERQVARIRELGGERKIPVVLIDSGFDGQNPDLLARMALDPDEPIDGIDNNGDGLIDNAAGFTWIPDHNIQTGEVASFLHFDGDLSTLYPVCHGSHVGDLMSRSLETHGLVAFGGDFTRPSYMEAIGRWLKQKQVRFANMSFDFGSSSGDNSPFSAPQAAQAALYQLIKSNPQTQFYIAAGNRPIDLDGTDNWPATIEVRNKVVVAALDTPELNLASVWSYKLTNFSTFGQQMVDVAAPGQQVVAWNGGNHQIPLSGTSMAAPIAANTGIRVAEANPSLSNENIKEILIKTSYIRDLQNPLPVKSGGVLIPQRAIHAAQLLSSGEFSSIEEASLAALRDMPLFRELEGSDVADLKRFWRSRGI